MPGQKRKRSQSPVHGLGSSVNPPGELDISSALAGVVEGDEDLHDIIQSSITKRDVKDGTDVLKKVKGKKRLVKGEVGGGSFQSMGLHPSLLRSLTLQGYRIPTPIQRLAIPSLLANPSRDLVAMARTGSGKSLAYMVPLVQRLGGRHTTTFGARALILLPTRELALQILKVGKELARGWHAADGGHAGDSKDLEEKKGQSLRWGLVVGGEGMDEQFEMITNNPDIIIATPGRLLHLIVEMNLDLKSVEHAVFDEADRLFEMGFETALNEILHRLPTSRQSMLFSATLPKSLVEFAKAGLQNPKLVRLDAESKISSDLKMAFFSVKQTEKDACLLSLLRDVIQVPVGNPKANDQAEHKTKRKHAEQVTAPHQTLVFASTKHHVEYLLNLLTAAGYAVSHIYGSLDQAARTFQMDQFRRGLTTILVVTDVAARGIDIPVLENVVNFDFPQGSRIFVHRVGRTARAGRQGWAWSFVTNTELPYLLDLQLFLGRPLRCEVHEDGDQVYAENLILGTFERDKIDVDVEFIRTLDEENHALPTLREVMRRGHVMYEKSKGRASQASHRRAKDMIKEGGWMLAGSESGVHSILLRGKDRKERRVNEEKRKSLMKTINAFRPNETVFEVGKKGDTENAKLMNGRRKALEKAKLRTTQASSSMVIVNDDESDDTEREAPEMADEEQIAAVFDTGDRKGGKSSAKGYRDAEFYMSHYQKDAATDKGYSLSDGTSAFAKQAKGVTFDLAGDEGLADRKRRQLNWDKSKKKFIKGDGEGADNVKLIKTESGTRLPASYRSGRFDEWKAKTKVNLPRIGEMEPERARRGAAPPRKFRHTKIANPKPLDKLSKDYGRKIRQMKKKEAESVGGSAIGKGKKDGGRYRGKPLAKVKSELKTRDQIRKNRSMLEKRRAKNARPSRRKGRH